MSDWPLYQIRIKTHLDETLIDWFAPLTLVNEPDGEATLTGVVRDQAELHGLLDRIFELNLLLMSVNRMIDSTDGCPCCGTKFARGLAH